MIYTLTRDDIPSLSAWIKKSDKSKLVGFFGGEQGILSRRYPRLSPRFARCPVGRNSPVDCFFPQTSFAPSLFESLALTLNKKEKEPRVATLFFLAESKGYTCFAGYVLGCHCFATAPPQTSELKTIRRIVFFTLLTPSGFESLALILNKKEKEPHFATLFFLAESKGFEPSNRL